MMKNSEVTIKPARTKLAIIVSATNMSGTIRPVPPFLEKKAEMVFSSLFIRFGLAFLMSPMTF
jgi:hypothetical protein